MQSAKSTENILTSKQIEVTIAHLKKLSLKDKEIKEKVAEFLKIMGLHFEGSFSFETSSAFLKAIEFYNKNFAEKLKYVFVCKNFKHKNFISEIYQVGETYTSPSIKNIIAYLKTLVEKEKVVDDKLTALSKLWFEDQYEPFITVSPVASFLEGIAIFDKALSDDLSRYVYDRDCGQGEIEIKDKPYAFSNWDEFCEVLETIYKSS